MTADTRRRWLKRIARLGVVLFVLLLMLRWFEHKQTYHPSRSFHLTGAELGRPWEDVYFTTSDGERLNAWFFPASTNSSHRDLAVIVCHGNGGNISHRLGLYDILLNAGVNVLAFDYRGYGRSEGKPGEDGTYRDAQAAFAWLQEKGFAANKIIVYGESLGGGIASELTVREPVGGLILQSTFTSVTDLGKELFPFLPVRTLGSIRYDTHSKLPNIHVPVLILHSRSDNLIRFAHAERNFAVANEPKWLLELTGDHNDATDDREPFQRGLAQLFDQITVAK